MLQSSLLDSGIGSQKRRLSGANGKENSPNKKARKALASAWSQQHTSDTLYDTDHQQQSLLNQYYSTTGSQDQLLLVNNTRQRSIATDKGLMTPSSGEPDVMGVGGSDHLLPHHLSPNSNLLANIIGGSSTLRGSMIHHHREQQQHNAVAPTPAGPSTSINTSGYSFRAGSVSPETPVSAGYTYL